MSTAQSNPDPVHDWPLWWFARLEAAIERGDYQAAAHAQRELEGLGVGVQYCGRRRQLPQKKQGGSLNASTATPSVAADGVA